MSGPIGPGDWVECVDASPCAWTGKRFLERGKIYRVRNVYGDGRHPNGTRGPGLRLAEIVRENGTNGKERGWNASRFRPIYRPSQSLIRDLQQPISAGLVEA